MAYPDYGTPGNPNMDPYYMSPEQERVLEEQTEQEAELRREAFRDALQACIDNERGDLSDNEVFDVLTAIMLDPQLKVTRP